MTIRYREGFQPGDLGSIVRMHGVYYAGVWGSGSAFEATVAQELGGFYERYDADRDLLLTVHHDGMLIGSIAICSTSEPSGCARLRWFLLEEGYHGLGIGRTLLEKALDFCRDHRFDRVYLWTVEGLPRSLELYTRAGFQEIERIQDDRHSVPHTNIRLELTLSTK